MMILIRFSHFLKLMFINKDIEISIIYMTLEDFIIVLVVVVMLI